MRHTITALATACLSLALTLSCSKSQGEDGPQDNQINLKATLLMPEGIRTHWDSSSQIGVTSMLGGNSRFPSQSKGSSTTETFSGQVIGMLENLFAYYPYASQLSSIEVPHSQTPERYCPQLSAQVLVSEMFRRGNDVSVKMRPATSILALRFLNSKALEAMDISHVKISSQKPLAGQVSLDLKEGTVQAGTQTQKHVWADLSALALRTDGLEYAYISVLPLELDRGEVLDVEVVADAKTYLLKLTLDKTLSLKASQMQVLSVDLASATESQDSGKPGSATFQEVKAENPSSSTVVLKASFTAATSKPEEVGFIYGLTENALNQTKVASLGTATTSGSFQAELTGLSANTQYYFKSYVKVNGTYDFADETVTVFSTVGSFKTLEQKQDPEPGEGEAAIKRNWAELPVYLSGSDLEYHTHEKLPSNRNLRNYSFCFDRAKHCSLWVAYPLHDVYFGSASRQNSFNYDPCCVDDKYEAAISSNAYYPKGGGSFSHSRGHQLPSSDRTASAADNNTTFYATNMTPQVQDFNGNIWERLEDKVRGWVCTDTLYVVTGAHFDGSEKYAYDLRGTGKACAVPTHYYKVLLRTKSGSSRKRVQDCSASELQCVGFWFQHKANSGQPSSSDMRSVEEIENLTGFKFFANVPNAPKSTYQAKDWGL